jgi:peroxiredoxin Q/BCP
MHTVAVGNTKEYRESQRVREIIQREAPSNRWPGEKRMKIFRVLSTCVIFLSFTVTLFAGSAPSVGSAAPEFTLNSQEGSPVSLKDFHGKWVVLYFYPKDFTSGCTIEAHNFQRDLSQYQQKNAVILGVSVDSPDSHKQFCAKEGLNFKLLADTDYKVSTEYDSLMTYNGAKMASRHTFIISPDGKVVKTFTEVNPNKHSEEVLTALAELQK